MIRAVGRAAVVALGLSLTACPSGNPDLDCPQGPTTVTAQQLFDSVQGPICSNCHNPNNLSLPNQGTVAALRALVNVDSAYGHGLKVVAPNNLGNSVMWLKVNGGSPAGFDGPAGAAVGGAMPPSGAGFPALDAAKKGLIRDWICTGATG